MTVWDVFLNVLGWGLIIILALIFLMGVCSLIAGWVRSERIKTFAMHYRLSQIAEGKDIDSKTKRIM